MTPIDLKTEGVRWDLSCLYKGIGDPQIDRDIAEYVRQVEVFGAKYKGKLAELLPQALADFIALRSLGDPVGIYLFLEQSCDMPDGLIQAKIAAAQEKMVFADGEHMSFFMIELVAIPDEILEKHYAADALVAKHRPWIEQARVFKPYLLSEAVESALTKRAPFSDSAWGDFFGECEADLRFAWNGGEKALPEMLNILSTSPDRAERAEALRIINAGFAGFFAKYSARSLYMVAGSEQVERIERKYATPMTARNRSNLISDEVVGALHAAVTDVAGPLMRRYFKLKAKALGIPVLAWSDRNAPYPAQEEAKVPFDEGLKTALAAYESFSPTLAGIIRQTITDKRIDAPATKGKRGGAYNYSFVDKAGKPLSFTFLNYLGSEDDVMVLAHELGHGVHGILAGEAQGPLMCQAPIAYAETASTFGEMVAFDFLKEELKKKGDDRALFALITQKIESVVNTVVRQIAFSNFERRLHGMSADYASWGPVKKLSVAELDALWLETTQEIYGKPGEVFTYENAEHLWSYIGHFHTYGPFYVYGYAFGELLVHSLYAKRGELGDRFEPLYLDMLRAGGTKDATALLAPFGLDPARESFWADGINAGLGMMIAEAEALYEKLKG